MALPLRSSSKTDHGTDAASPWTAPRARPIQNSDANPAAATRAFQSERRNRNWTRPSPDLLSSPLCARPLPRNQNAGNNSHLSESDRCESFLRLGMRSFLREPHHLARRSPARRSRSCTLDGNSRQQERRGKDFASGAAKQIVRET